MSEKGDYDHFMHKEIHEQPELIRSLTHYYFAGEGVPALEKAIEKKPENIHMVACGTAFYAGLVIKDHVEKLNRIRCHAELGSEFRYKNPVLESNDLGLFISQSGETADTLAAQSLCKTNGLSTMSIVNVEGSTLFRDCEDNLLIRAGIEVGVASTKAFTQQVLTGMVFSAALNGILSNAEKKKIWQLKFSSLAERVDKVLPKKIIEDVAREIHIHKKVIFTGERIYYPIALEGALKLKEIAYVHAEGYASGELKH